MTETILDHINMNMDMSSPLFRLSSDQWMDIIQYLGVGDFKSLRLAGNKVMCLSDPKLTSHLTLRMDKVPFFDENVKVKSMSSILDHISNLLTSVCCRKPVNRGRDDGEWMEPIFPAGSPPSGPAAQPDVDDATVATSTWSISAFASTVHPVDRQNKGGDGSQQRRLCFSKKCIQKWLENRTRLVINDVHARISPSRVTYFIENGFLDSASQVIVHDCHHHRTTVEALSKLPAIRSLSLIDPGDQSESIRELEAIIFHVGSMTSLTALHIEFDTVLHGSRLSFLSGLQDLQHLRLLGFDLSEGINHLGHLQHLESLHLCHGNFYSSPDDDINEKNLTDLASLKKLQRLHLEGFDCLQGYGLGPFVANGSIQHLVMKHCQEMNDECLFYIGRMTNLTSLHFILGECDDIDVFSVGRLQHLNSLSALKSLSLFRVLGDVSDLRVLPGLSNLETLNVEFDEPMDDEDEVEELCTTVISVFPSLQKMRIFSEDCMEHSFYFGRLNVEYCEISFGDCVYLD